MKTKRISDGEITPLKISSLPSRPTLPTQYGGRGYSASDMKEAFDALPLLIAQRLNSLIDDISADFDASIATEIHTGSDSLPTLSDIFRGIESGELAESIKLSDQKSLAFTLLELSNEIEKIKSHLNISEG